MAEYWRTGPDSLTVRASLGLSCTSTEEENTQVNKKSQKAFGLIVRRNPGFGRKTLSLGSRPSSLALWQIVRKPMTQQKSLSVTTRFA